MGWQLFWRCEGQGRKGLDTRSKMTTRPRDIINYSEPCLLVEEYDVGLPNLVGHDTNDGYSPEVARLPA